MICSMIDEWTYDTKPRFATPFLGHRKGQFGTLDFSDLDPDYAGYLYRVLTQDCDTIGIPPPPAIEEGGSIIASQVETYGMPDQWDVHTKHLFATALLWHGPINREGMFVIIGLSSQGNPIPIAGNW